MNRNLGVDSQWDYNNVPALSLKTQHEVTLASHMTVCPRYMVSEE